MKLRKQPTRTIAKQAIKNAEVKQSINEVDFRTIEPKVILSRLPFEDTKCPLIISEQGNATALFRYSNGGSFVELSNPLSENLREALKYSIKHGEFCVFNFGPILKLEMISEMLDRLKAKCLAIHVDLYDHIINNTLMKQSFEKLVSLLNFNSMNELVPEIYQQSQKTFRLLFFTQIDNIASIKLQQNNANLLLFNCIFIKP